MVTTISSLGSRTESFHFVHVFASFVSPSFFHLCFPSFVPFCLLWYLLAPLSLVFSSLFFFGSFFFFGARVFTFCLFSMFYSVFILVLSCSSFLSLSSIVFLGVSCCFSLCSTSFFVNLIPCAWLKRTIVAHGSEVCCSDRVTELWRRRYC